jgi:hypothetical protein
MLKLIFLGSRPEDEIFSTERKIEFPEFNLFLIFREQALRSEYTQGREGTGP